MAHFDSDLFYERRLPHYQPAGATLFITFRLAGSMPISNAFPTNEVTNLVNRKLFEPGNVLNLVNYQRRFEWTAFHNWDCELDKVQYGPAWLSNPIVAKTVWDAIQYLDNKQYTLDAFCIMPNHVHFVCTPLKVNGNYIPIPKIMHSIKGYTAKRSNKAINRVGQFWQHESYDHV